MSETFSGIRRTLACETAHEIECQANALLRLIRHDVSIPTDIAVSIRGLAVRIRDLAQINTRMSVGDLDQVDSDRLRVFGDLDEISAPREGEEIHA